MRNSRNQFILLITVSLALIGVFLFLPKLPSSSDEKVEKMVSNPDSLQLAQAVELVNGANPMEGIKMLQALVEKNDKNLEAHMWLGRFAIQSGQYDKAKARYEKILSIDPKFVDAYLDLGGIYMEQDSAQSALTYFKKALEIDPTYDYALALAAQTENKLGLYSEAKKDYEALLKLTTDTVVTKRVNELIKEIDSKTN